MVDAGNIYEQHYEWDYLSTPLEAPAKSTFARLHWKAKTDRGTGIEFQVRTAAGGNTAYRTEVAVECAR